MVNDQAFSQVVDGTTFEPGYEDDQDGSFSDLPVACATLVHTSISPIDDPEATGPRERLNFNAADPTVDALLSYSRPEFIFASACVSDTERKLGIFLKNRRKGRGAYVVRLADDSPFLNCNIQPGDHVVAVNNYLCSGVKAKRVVELINTTSKNGTVSICVHNPTGNPYSVSCSVQKSHQTARCGVALQTRRGAVRVSRVDKDGLFGDSLLMPRHRCMMINGISCSHMSSKTAADFIVSLPDRVTIVTRPEESYAMTIALCQKTKWWNKFSSRAGLAVRAKPALKTL
eukprot:scaffold13351_cov200-Amphora_coffeaeformis.AAC.7